MVLRHRPLTAILAMFLFISCAFPLGAAEPVVRAFYFFSQDCSHCQAVLGEVLPPLLQKYGSQLELRYFDIAATDNYRALLALEKRYGVTQPDIPEIFLGEEALVGEAAIRARLNGVIQGVLAGGGVEYPDPALLPAAVPTPHPAPGATATLPPQYERLPPEGCKWCDRRTYGDKPIVYLAYVYDTSCEACDRVSFDLRSLHDGYPNLYVRSINVKTEAALAEALAQHYGVSADKHLVAPAVFAGQDYLIAPDINAESLAALIDKYAISGSKPPWDLVNPSEARQSIIERFRSFGALTILLAGLIDGINPCAFAGLIFFVSYLAVTKRRGREILLVGGAFTAGVFLSYLLVGLGILGFVRQLSFVQALARAIYLATIALCLLLSVLSLHDYVQVRGGKKEDIVLRLPKPLQDRLHRVIRERSRIDGFVWAALVTGFLVALIEFACTGQVYLPTVIFVTGVPELRIHAVAFLVIYNLAFITPLVVVFALTFFGTTWRALNRFLETHMASLKLVTAALFAVLALWLGVYLL
jgi:cytochrome c biogenesis protein CcdA/thiol-disulfide isomerase/thioredoxin